MKENKCIISQIFSKDTEDTIIKKYSIKYDDYFLETARVYGIDFYVIKAMGICESNLNCDAVSSAGACGIMQIMFPTWEDMNLYDWSACFVASCNIRVGGKYLKWLKERGLSDNEIIIAYNCGIGYLRRLKEEVGINYFIYLYPETQNYFRKVKEVYLELKAGL